MNGARGTPEVFRSGRRHVVAPTAAVGPGLELRRCREPAPGCAGTGRRVVVVLQADEPDRRPVPARGVAPILGAAPARGTVLTRGTGPIRGTVLTRRTVPTRGTVPPRGAPPRPAGPLRGLRGSPPWLALRGLRGSPPWLALRGLRGSSPWLALRGLRGSPHRLERRWPPDPPARGRGTAGAPGARCDGTERAGPWAGRGGLRPGSVAAAPPPGRPSRPPLAPRRAAGAGSRRARSRPVLVSIG
jgi:hypothetical protein